MDRLLRTFFSIHEISVKKDDDFADRLSRQFSTSLLIAMSLIVSTKQFVGDPIACWCPAHFTDSHRQYTNNVCWVSNTYYLPFDRTIPPPPDLKDHKRLISYYQWVPLMLMCQAVAASVPCLLWKFLNIRSGIDVGSLIDTANVCQRASYSEIRDKTIRYMVNQIDRYLISQRDYRKGCCVRIKQMLSRYCFIVGGKRHGNYLTVMFIVVKLCYALNAIGQLFLMDIFLGMEYHVYGIFVIAKMVRGDDWASSTRFPRVTLCTFEIRHQARLHDYVVQCSLTINLFNEKIFVILWFWYVFVAIVTCVSAIQWIARSLYWPGQIHYVRKKLKAFEVSSRSKATLSKFAQSYLRRDGILLLRLISQNVSEMVAAETLVGLWENYNPDRRLLGDNSRTRNTGVTGVGNLPGTMEVV